MVRVDWLGDCWASSFVFICRPIALCSCFPVEPPSGSPSGGKNVQRRAAAAAAAEAKAAAALARAASKGGRRESAATADALPALAPFVPRMLREQVAAAQRQNPGRVQVTSHAPCHQADVDGLLLIRKFTLGQ